MGSQRLPTFDTDADADPDPDDGEANAAAAAAVAAATDDEVMDRGFSSTDVTIQPSIGSQRFPTLLV